MRSLLAAALLAAAALATPAHADVTQPNGRPCSWGYLTADRAYLYGGPVTVADEDDPSAVHTATLTCSLRDGLDHTAPAVHSVTGPASAGAAAVPLTLFDYVLDGSGQYPPPLCSRIDYDGGTLYWQDPGDRNEDGWWSTDPTVPCTPSWRTLDLRPQDPPLGYAVAGAMTAAGELGAVVAAAEPVVCSVPEVDAAAEGLACGAPVVLSTMSFARVPGAAVVRTLPAGRTCTDVHTGAVLAVGSVLATPDPGMACDATDPAYAGTPCGWQELSAYLAPTTLGRVAVSQGCGTASISRVLATGQGRLVEQWSGHYGGGTGTIRCGATEDTTGPAEPAYVVVCNTF